MSIARSLFGHLSSGEEVQLFTLKAGDFTVTMSDYGAHLLSALLPAGSGRQVDVLLGPASFEGLLQNSPYFGATVGRVANRIAGARFSLDGVEYRLDANDGANHLHGGILGFNNRLWTTEAFESRGEPALRFSLTSPDGDEGYPGELSVAATYRLSSEGRLHIAFEASTQASTLVNLTNHAYFNLKGRGDILGHELRLACSRYLPGGADLCPTGEIAAVEGGPFDFRAGKAVGRDIASVEGGAAGAGYDHCFALDRTGPGLVDFAWLREPESGRGLRVSTTLPGVQLYTGNFLARVPGKRGAQYQKYAGLCLETQFFPDAPHRPAFPSIVLRPGQAWSHETVFAFEP